MKFKNVGKEYWKNKLMYAYDNFMIYLFTILMLFIIIMVSQSVDATDSCSTNPADYKYGYIDFNSNSPAGQWNTTAGAAYSDNGFNYLSASATNSVYEGNASGSFKVTSFVPAVRQVSALSLTDTALEFFANFTCDTIGTAFVQLRQDTNTRLFCGVDCSTSLTKIDCGGSATSADIGTGFHRYKIVNNGANYDFYQDTVLIYTSSSGNDANRIYLTTDNAAGFVILDKMMIYDNSVTGDCPTVTTTTTTTTSTTTSTTITTLPSSSINISTIKQDLNGDFLTFFDLGTYYKTNNATTNLFVVANISTGLVTSCDTYSNYSASLGGSFCVGCGMVYSVGVFNNDTMFVETNYSYYTTCIVTQVYNFSKNSSVTNILHDNKVPSVNSAVCTTCDALNHTTNVPSFVINTSDLSGVVQAKVSLNASATFDNLINNGSNCTKVGVTNFSCTPSGTLTLGYNSVYFFAKDDLGNYANQSLFNATIFNDLNITNCSVGDPNLKINISIFHEDTLSLLAANNFSGIFTFYATNSSQGINKTYSFQNLDNYGICINTGSNVNYDAYLTYSVNTGFGERYYIFNASTIYISQILLYNFDYTTGLSELNLLATDDYFVYYPEVITKMQRFYPAENVWRTVQVDKTDYNGRALFYVKQNSNDYRFVFDYLGKQQMISSKMKFICDSATSCDQTFIINPSVSSQYEGMTTSYVYDNTTGVITYSWNDPSNTASSVELLVQKVTPAAITTICDTTVSSASGSINCDVSSYDGFITVKAIRDDPELFEYFSIDKVVDTMQEALGGLANKKMGIFFAGILVIGISLAGLASPFLTIVLAVVALFVINSLGFLSILTTGIIIGFACLGVIIGFMVKQ
jgi:hypothetical protein